MGFAKPIEQYLFSNLLIRIHVFMYLKDIIRGRKWNMTYERLDKNLHSVAKGLGAFYLNGIR